MIAPFEWQVAFALQAKADFETWERLQGCADVPRCHKLHFLQMACEKLAKAHLSRSGSQPRDIQASHAYFAKSFPKIAENHWARMRQKPGSLKKVARSMRNLARQVELLSPSVDDNGTRPDNCEYPWELPNGSLRIPAEYGFPDVALLTENAGRTLLKIVKEAITHLASRRA